MASFNATSRRNEPISPRIARLTQDASRRAITRRASSLTLPQTQVETAPLTEEEQEVTETATQDAVTHKDAIGNETYAQTIARIAQQSSTGHVSRVHNQPTTSRQAMARE